MIIGKDKVVSLSYELTVEGNLVDKSKEGDSLTFLFGSGQMIPGFEKNLEGMNQDDNYSFVVAPEEGYGLVNESAIVEVDKQIFVTDGELLKDLKQGAVIPMQDQEGNKMEGIVENIGIDKVKMNFNHPLAGKELNFSGQISEVRDASTEEIDHGHVHGPGGHQH